MADFGLRFERVTKLMGMRQPAQLGKQKVSVLVFIAAMVAGLCCAAAQAEANAADTPTTAIAESRMVNGRSVTTISLTVAGDAETAATGSVTLVEHGKAIAGAALDAEGKVTIPLDGLTPGDHTLKAVYGGDADHEASTSESLSVHADATTSPDFAINISTDALTIAAPGGDAQLTATVAPVTGTGFTGFLSLSCSGPSVSSGAPGGSALPFGVTCTFSPANLEVTAPTTANSTGAQNANLTIQTTAPSGSTAVNRPASGLHNSKSPLVLAVLLPGVLALGFLARKRSVLYRGAMMVMLCAVTLLGTAACSPRYKYFHHPPTYNPGTAAGVYTITVTAQTSNGVTATEHSQTLSLTVK